MKPRNFHEDAWELCRQLNSPGCVALVEKSMEFGYGLGLKDATGEMNKLEGEIKKMREHGNKPQ